VNRKKVDYIRSSKFFRYLSIVPIGIIVPELFYLKYPWDKTTKTTSHNLCIISRLKMKRIVSWSGKWVFNSIVLNGCQSFIYTKYQIRQISQKKRKKKEVIQILVFT
jgi:hypothetical protein